MHATGLTVTAHSLTVDGSAVPVNHIWLLPGNRRAEGLLEHEHFMYAYRPLAAATRYRVRVTGVRAGAPVELSWAFTTR